MPKCFECGSKATVSHHVVPRSLGGTKTVRLCDVCHAKIHNTDVTMQGLAKAARRRTRGQLYHGGVVPWGYDMQDDGTLVENEAEQYAIMQMIALRATGMTWAEIARTLDDMGIKTKRGGKWYRGVVRRIVMTFVSGDRI